MAIINRAMVQIVPSAEPAEQVPVVEDELNTNKMPTQKMIPMKRMSHLMRKS